MKSVPLISGGLSFLLSACSGGGSFDVDNVSNTPSSKPRYQDDTSSSRTKSKLEKLSIPSLGGGMKLVALNLFDRNKPSLLNEDSYMIFSSRSTIEEDVKNNNQNGEHPIDSIVDPRAPNSNENRHGQKYVYSGLYYIQSWSLRDLPNKKFYSGYYGYAYYFGNTTASALPVGGVATYKGTWSFITAAENGKNYELLRNSGGGQAYSRRSATPEDIDLDRKTGLTSEFTVNFGTKKLTGGLYYNLRETDANKSQNRTHKLYDLEADVHSNRFRGKVKPTKKESSEEHPFTSEGTLEGGFYGPEGQELGGKFLAHDKKVFGVFSAKEQQETSENKKLPRETLIDGKLITFKTTDATTSTTTNTAANAENFTTKDISSFGEADYLLIDNQPIPLFPEEKTDDFATSKLHKVGDKTYQVEACCSNLSYVKFGMYYEAPPKEEEKDKEKKEKQATKSINTYYQFLLGHRTAKDDIPKTGSAKYHGNWFGYIGDGSTSYSTSGDKERNKNAVAEFDVNFADKTLTGTLKRHDNGNPVFTINADFKKGGNDFTGTATATNFVIDGNNSHTGNTPINITTKVNGAFYGPKASELGGYFTYNGKDTITKNTTNSADISSTNSKNARAAVVFGAKKQVETTK
ncbi:TPA: transferrin-binding protein-like solute binding protein [Haemophilus influenzae]|uniref:transferrin-binding protein-like solute binding protein n=1 Tax=Haemophilus influenzae TaxID=727 RepID=UPI000C32E6B1|nr:transferrin-binding protein-like solute binding protein [Haemophilus influenzae]PKF67372.1 transferrin-binding protein 2 [Haemophilus influenzae]